jgi:hypothetical protein
MEREKRRKEFLASLDKASAIVATWPKWKQTIVSKYLSPYEKERI